VLILVFFFYLGSALDQNLVQHDNLNVLISIQLKFILNIDDTKNNHLDYFGNQLIIVIFNFSLLLRINRW